MLVPMVEPIGGSNPARGEVVEPRVVLVRLLAVVFVVVVVVDMDAAWPAVVFPMVFIAAAGGMA